MIELDIKQPEKKTIAIFARIPKSMDDQINAIVKKHKVDKSIAIRSIIEIGLKSIK